MPARFVARSKLNNAILAVQTAIMERPNLAGEAPEKAAALAWLLASRSSINAVLFIPPAHCRRPQDVGYRLATVDLATLAGLKIRQDSGQLTPKVINNAVWQSIAA
ncbi:hypothetical protein PsB1_2190 [Candidatus Phycosocius spiralis]|uniref:Uncharacterized protein n=2 Tax=Candidatus Phycosocius spiralis TaxID=2815099 RepID=A0ABQ4PY85_9PROT|nr:hypothetical protein PsB1_2190 [Candidatus Phycosocius spiralis]